MNTFLKCLIIAVVISLVISFSTYAEGIRDQEVEPINKACLGLTNTVSRDKSDFDSEKNYQELKNAYFAARTNKAYNDAIHTIYKFVDKNPEDPYSVDLLDAVAIFFPMWESDVNVVLYRKIKQFPKHPKLYEAHMTLYFYGKKKDKRVAKWNFKKIAKDHFHPRQKDAREFLDAIGKDWDDL